MNGLIQHLAASGLDLSEDNVLGIESSPNEIIFKSSLPEDFYILSYYGNVYLNSQYKWNDCWEIAIFRCNKTNFSSEKIKSIFHQNEAGYKAFIYVDSSYIMRGCNVSPNDDRLHNVTSIPCLYLKSI